jgi:HK97 family phage major capsid protein
VDALNSLWGLSVVVTEAQTQNTALVGDFRQAILWEREGVNVMVSDQHSDFFTRNLLAILAERRAAFGVLDPEAFCTITAVLFPQPGRVAILPAPAPQPLRSGHG